MPKKPEYEITISVQEVGTGQLVGQRSTGSSEIIEQTIGDLAKWMENWEKQYTVECSECGNYTIHTDVSYKSTDAEYEKPVCQDCIELIIEGKKQPKE